MQHSGKAIKKMRNLHEIIMMTDKAKDKNPSSLDTLTGSFDIPVKGSLGLLALGAVGIKAWRKVRREAGAEQEGEKPGKQEAEDA